MEKLLKEERLIMHALSVFGRLKKEQLYELIKKKGSATKSIYEGLKKRQYIEEFNGDYVRLDPRTDASEKTIDAFWVLLNRIEKMNVSQDAYYQANYPSEIFFMRENMMYEIICINPGEEYQLKALFLENRYNSDSEDDMVKYIIVLQDDSYIDSCISSIPEEALEKTQVVFATLTDSVTEIKDASGGVSLRYDAKKPQFWNVN